MSQTLDVSKRGGRSPSAETSGAWETVRKVLKPIASLKLTVVLFVLCMILVLCGTLAQVDHGIQNVVQKYFRSVGIIWIPFQLFFPRDLEVKGVFPFPGGWLLGALLVANLLAAHITRFRFTVQRSGIVLMHAGVLLLLLGELVAGMFQVESRMDILEGSFASYVYQPGAVELALVRPGSAKEDETISIPGSLLKPGERISSDKLPFDVVVDQYWANSRLVSPGLSNPQPLTHPQWAAAVPEELPVVTGADPDQQIDVPSAKVTLKKKGTDQTLATEVVSIWLDRIMPPITRKISVDGKTYEMALRFKRDYKPYTIHLEDFHHEKYLGTSTPKDFKSDVRLVDPSRNEDRKLSIWMNHPLRHAGETFYQADFRPDNMGTVLQVVRNPGWLMPYIACGLVSVGMLIHFGITLTRFLNRIL